MHYFISLDLKCNKMSFYLFCLGQLLLKLILLSGQEGSLRVDQRKKTGQVVVL